MHHKKMSEFLKKFKFNQENQGDKLVITLEGKEEDIKKLERKIEAFKVLKEDCCDCC